MGLTPLPIDRVLPRLVEVLRDSRGAVVRAPTGAGKTTRVPPAILNGGLAGEGAVLVLEPRRLAARAAARRMAFERGGRLGEEVGFSVRFDRRAGPRTRIEVVTEGILLRRLQADPYLVRAGAVVFDEFHERNLDSDLALAMVRRLQAEARPELAICVMSATLAPEPLARFLGDAPVIESHGRAFEVEPRYLDAPPRERQEELCARAVDRALAEIEGDVLVFLPGRAEIRRARSALEGLARRRGLDLLELYSDLPAERQDAVLRRGPRRKVVLSTNVAETSVTIEGIGAVVDTGMARVLRCDRSVGLDRLELSRISRASADQRAGRAGRTAPGLCFRLWSLAEHRSLAERDEPEIRRVDLARAVLELRAWGEADPAAFPWFEAPEPAALERAESLLARLGALDGRGLTELGTELARLPLHPRLGRLLVEASRRGCLERASLLAALLSERDPFVRMDPEGGGRLDSDPFERLRALEDFEARGSRSAAAPRLRPAAARFVLRARDQLRSLLPRSSAETEDEEALARSLLLAWPDRVARRREPGSPRGVMVGGRGVRLLDEHCAQDSELFLCAVLDAGRRGERAEALVRQAVPVERAWLPAGRLNEESRIAFDEASEAVWELRRVLFEDLVLEEKRVPPSSEEEAARVLAEAAAARLDRALPLAGEAVATFLARVRSLSGWMPELELPAFDEAELAALLPALCAGRRSFAELRRLPLLDWLRAQMSPEQSRALEREAPERIEVPSGSRIRLTYEPGRPPVLAARIQELFGLEHTPRVAAGRVPVLMHLLAPNMRPQQVTDDLESFWSTTYSQVRKELRRRYPRHAWPEDPRRAEPQRRPGGRRGG